MYATNRLAQNPISGDGQHNRAVLTWREAEIASVVDTQKIEEEPDRSVAESQETHEVTWLVCFPARDPLKEDDDGDDAEGFVGTEVVTNEVVRVALAKKEGGLHPGVIVGRTLHAYRDRVSSSVR
jgi:hypothetical protein